MGLAARVRFGKNDNRYVNEFKEIKAFGVQRLAFFASRLSLNSIQ
jgi:hypothetical protein